MSNGWSLKVLGMLGYESGMCFISDQGPFDSNKHSQITWLNSPQNNMQSNDLVLVWQMHKEIYNKVFQSWDFKKHWF